MAKPGPRRAVSGGGGQGRAAGTRAALVRAAIVALREVGFAGASAREIARRAGCNQASVFYHFGGVTDLLLAALDEVSAQRLAVYRDLMERADAIPDLVGSGRAIFVEDLDAGHVAVLLEMISGAQSTPGLGEQVSDRLAPWREFAESAVRKAFAATPVAVVMPAALIAHAVLAGFLGLELLANLDGDRTKGLALFDQAGLVAELMAGGRR